MHDIKDIRKNPEKYRDSQRKRGAGTDIIDKLLLDDEELRAYKTIEQDRQSKVNKLSDEYGREKHRGAAEHELLFIQLDIEMANLDATIAHSDKRIEFIERRQWAIIDAAFGGRDGFEKACEEIDARKASEGNGTAQAPEGIPENRPS